MSASKTKRNFTTFITIGFVLFIFSNSMFPGPNSSEKSQFVMNLINNLISRIGMNASITEHFVRKCSHFLEYFMLGNLLLLTVRMYVKKPTKYIFMEFFSLLAVPVLDEFLQTFIQGRSGNISDVILDFSSGVVGLFFNLFIVHLFVSMPKSDCNDISRK